MHPKPECKSGYTERQLVDILGDRLEEFNTWIYGQTMVLCTGQVYDHEQGMYYAEEAEAHGPVVYPWDLWRFLAGREVVD